MFPKRSKSKPSGRPSVRFSFKSRHIFVRAMFTTKPQEATSKTMTDVTKMTRAELDDLADKATESIEERVQKLAQDPRNASVPRDQLFQRAIQAEFAKNRTFAQAWKQGPSFRGVDE